MYFNASIISAKHMHFHDMMIEQMALHKTATSDDIPDRVSLTPTNTKARSDGTSQSIIAQSSTP
jgi:hypothetical protein